MERFAFFADQNAAVSFLRHPENCRFRHGLLARDGDPEDLYFEETETRFAIGWKGNYHIEGAAFIFTDRDSGRMVTILGYPTQRLAQLGSEISNMFG
jgi:hypothetical protein